MRKVNPSDVKVKIFDVAIIGGGSAGVMAHLRAVLNANHALLIRGNSWTQKRARSTWIHSVDNIPGMHNIKNPVRLSSKQTLEWISSHSHLHQFSTVIQTKAINIEKKDQLFLIHHQKKDDASVSYSYAKHVVLATGVMDIQPKIEGEMEPFFMYANRGDLIYCVRCDGHHTIGKKISILGDKDSAVYIGKLMMERYGHKNIDIVSTHRRPKYSQDALKLAKNLGMRIHKKEIKSIYGDSRSGLRGFKLEEGNEIQCSKAIVALGIIAYNHLLLHLKGAVDIEGRAIVSEKFESSVANVFVVGDLVSGKKMQIYTGWDAAVDAADEIDRRVRALASNMNDES
ncbi:MAG: NAD(P)/FAD-dependent oxidoreductase [Bdellovibrionales bacterium]|nr:NAD(P)/FAD-dependent oxidoreductase [Bdellovibrionales bacterium]